MPEQSPEIRALEFAQIVKLVFNPTPATPAEEAMQKLSGGLIIREFTPGGNPRAIPTGFAQRLRERITASLEGLNITGSFTNHVMGMIDEVSASGIMRMIGPDYLLEQCGIRVQGDKVADPGFYDSTRAPEIEKEAIQSNYPSRSLFGAEDHNRKMATWVRDYTETHKSNPLES